MLQNEQAGELLVGCASRTAPDPVVVGFVGVQERRRCACFVVLAVVCLVRTVSQIALFAGLHGQCDDRQGC